MALAMSLRGLRGLRGRGRGSALGRRRRRGFIIVGILGGVLLLWGFFFGYDIYVLYRVLRIDMYVSISG